MKRLGQLRQEERSGSSAESVEYFERRIGQRPTSAEVASQIDEKIKALGDLVTVNVFEEYKTNIATQLGKLTDEIADNKSEIDRIGKLAEENGQSIVDLTGRISKLEEILEWF